ncbi:MAG: pantoate--beta-alanine ligase [Gammaproteobacteria bacterium]|nr:pantoate--beta-alanine ligase [Gammaproteobacteria bacterium]
MKTVSTVEALRAEIADWRRQGLTVAFVPTMGNLHQGHLDLCRHGAELADRVVVSIFVNPLQFGANEDLDSYPRTLAADQQKLQAQGVQLLFAPTEDQLYPFGREASCRVTVPTLTEQLCGAHRPGHFDGVATVVTKLLNLVQADVAVFGEKDFQQLAVIRRLVADLYIPTRIIGHPTTREASGLAMSSRNGYLSDEQRQQAAQIYATLGWAGRELQQGRMCLTIEHEARQALEQAGFAVEYFSICDVVKLQPLKQLADEAVILVAVRLGRTRLIDNLRVDLRK